MQTNPYKSPESSPIDVPVAQARRPISVWIFLLLFGIFAAAIAIGAVRFFWELISHWAEMKSSFAMVIHIVWRMALLAAFWLVLLGVFYRRQWARWVGLALLIAIAMFSIFGPDSTRYGSDAERLGGSIGRLALMPSLIAWWCYAFGFSEKATRYFDGSK